MLSDSLKVPNLTINAENCKVPSQSAHGEESVELNKLLKVNITDHFVFFKKQLGFSCLPSRSKSHPYETSGVSTESTRIPSKDTNVFSRLELFLVVLSIVVYLFDVVTDILLSWAHLSGGDYVSFSVTLGIVAISGLGGAICSIWWYMQEERCSIGVQAFRWIGSLFFLGPLMRFVKAIKLGVSSRKDESELSAGRRRAYLWSAHCELVDGATLRLFEAFLGAGPQLVFQGYLLLKVFSEPALWSDFTDNSYKVTIQCVSMVFSLLSLALSAVLYSKSVRLLIKQEEQVTLPQIILLFLWRAFEIIGRVAAMAIFLLVYQAWLGLVVAAHWLLMIVWSLRITESLCKTRLCEVVQAAGYGYTWIFCYIDIKDRETRKRHLVYYFLFAMENLVMVLMCLQQGASNDGWIIRIAVVGLVLGSLCISLSFMGLYYGLVHPRGRNSLPLCLHKEYWCSCEDLCNTGDRVQDCEVRVLPLPPRSSFHGPPRQDSHTDSPDGQETTELTVTDRTPLTASRSLRASQYTSGGPTGDEVVDMPKYTAPEPYETINDEEEDVPMMFGNTSPQYIPWPRITDLRYHIAGASPDDSSENTHKIAAWPDNAISLTGKALPNYRPPPMDTADREPAPVFVNDSEVRSNITSKKMHRLQSLPSYDAPDAPDYPETEVPYSFTSNALYMSHDSTPGPVGLSSIDESIATPVEKSAQTDLINDNSPSLEKSSSQTDRFSRSSSNVRPPLRRNKVKVDRKKQSDSGSSSDDEIVHQLPTRQSVISPQTVESFYMSTHFSSTPTPLQEESNIAHGDTNGDISGVTAFGDSSSPDDTASPISMKSPVDTVSPDSIGHPGDDTSLGDITLSADITDSSITGIADDDTPVKALNKEGSDKENSPHTAGAVTPVTPKKPGSLKLLVSTEEVSTPERLVLLSNISNA